MLKKILLGTLIAFSTFGIFSISEAHHGNDYECRDGYCVKKNYCCGNYYSDNSNFENCYGEGDCYRGGRNFGCR